MCLVCGLKNPLGLRGSFFEMETEELVCLFTSTDFHQSYPGRLHGGIARMVKILSRPASLPQVVSWGWQ